MRGKQAPMGVTASARSAQANADAAVARERAAVAVAQSAERGASVALEQKKAADARTKDALKYADKVWTYAGRGAPPFLG